MQAVFTDKGFKYRFMQPQLGLEFEVFTWIFSSRRTSITNYVKPRSLPPRLRLNANCLHMIATVFLMMVVNLARFAPSYR